MFTFDYATKKDIKLVKNLYKSAFPRDERAPYFVLERRRVKGLADMMVAKFDGDFAGFCYVVCNSRLAYVFYLAVVPNKRGQGIGSKILQAVGEKYADKKIFLARETLDESADNYAERIARHEFYLKNGFCDIDRRLKEASVVYDVMSMGGDVTPEEYAELIRAWGGKIMTAAVDMRIIPKNNG